MTITMNEFLTLISIAFRVVTPIIALFIVIRAFVSFKKSLRIDEPVIILEDSVTGEQHSVLYWENSIGRSKSCDIAVDDLTVSRDHAVLLRRKEGWFLCDTDSKSGTRVNRRKIQERKLINIGDKISIGNTELIFTNANINSGGKPKGFMRFISDGVSPIMLLILTNMVHLSMTLQLLFADYSENYYAIKLFLVIFGATWIFYLLSMLIFRRRNFEVETIGVLLSGIGIILISPYMDITTQLASFIIGMVGFIILLLIMKNVDLIGKFRLPFAFIAIGIFLLNMVIGTEINGSKNWIYVGGVSIQPSEIIKIIFILVGASTLDKLQTKKNISEFIIFAGICLGFLFVMRDFGSAVVFFACFLIIAFMRSGSIRTIALILAVAVMGVFLIISFMPYVADRFSGWGNVWEHIYDSYGYQQTRTLTYIASGGLFGMGLSNGYLNYIAAGESDLVFGMLCEDQGLLMGLVVVLSLVIFTLFALFNAKKSRSTFYSIAACGATGILLFQACLNIFGSTDILPLTGVTLPFISAGGTSMVSVWAMIAFIKASDERTYGKKITQNKND